MKTVGIICEYNPLHLGHKKQMDRIRVEFGPDTAIVCTMSGNFVQRGLPAIVDKSLRAKAAVLSGADLVLELPVTAALSSAEGFAAGGIKILSRMCDTLCFGAETGDVGALLGAARALLSPELSDLLRLELEQGNSFPAARQQALAKMGVDADILSRPNDILAVEYCKAILAQNASMDIFPIRREGSYHAETPDPENPSATAVRKLMLARPPLGGGWHGDSRDWGRECSGHTDLPSSLPQSASLTAPSSEGALGAPAPEQRSSQIHNWDAFIPEAARSVFAGAPLHSIEAGERAILGKLRTMTDAEFEALPYGSEGLWRKLMHASRSCAALEEILAATKSKRYTRTRLDRMVLCAFLGITREMLEAPVPYTRVLAFNDRGRAILKEAKKSGIYLNAGESFDHPYWELEKRTGDLYGLFRIHGIDPPGSEEKRRIFYSVKCGE